MDFTKITAAALCVVQLGLISPSFADTTKPSSEFTLLKNVIALQGAGLSQSDLQTRLGSVLTQYDQTANPEGQIDRLQTAMIELGVYTPDQASAFVTEAKEATQSGADLSKVLAMTMSNAPAGAQFSFCALGGGLLAAVGTVVVFVGVLAKTIATQSYSPAPTDFIIAGSVTLAGAVTLIVVGANGNC